MSLSNDCPGTTAAHESLTTQLEQECARWETACAIDPPSGITHDALASCTDSKPALDATEDDADTITSVASLPVVAEDDGETTTSTASCDTQTARRDDPESQLVESNRPPIDVHVSDAPVAADVPPPPSTPKLPPHPPPPKLNFTIDLIEQRVGNESLVEEVCVLARQTFQEADNVRQVGSGWRINVVYLNPNECQKAAGMERALIGFVLYKAVKKTACVVVSKVLVQKEYQGHGIGRKLMKVVFSYAKQMKCHIICLWAYHDVVGFYKRLGFHEVDPSTQAKCEALRANEIATYLECYLKRPAAARRPR